MIKLSVTCRGILLYNDKLLLMRHGDNDFYNLPGGKWEYDTEDIRECVKREFLEETGIYVVVNRLVFSQEFRTDSKIRLEMIWLVEPVTAHPLDLEHIITHKDTDEKSEITELKWIDIHKLQNYILRPAALSGVTTDLLYSDSYDPFIDTFVIG